MTLTFEDAHKILHFTTEYNGETYTTTPNEPMRDDLIWDYKMDVIIVNSWETPDGVMAMIPNEERFTLSKVGYVDQSDKEKLADILGISSDRNVTAKDFGITADSLSFKKRDDSVEHPSHYNNGKFETIEVIEEITKGYDDGFVAHCVGTATKYISRAPFKHGTPLEDLQKAAKYLEFAIGHLERE